MNAHSRLCPRWLASVGKRLAWFAAVLLAGGILGGALVRMAPGFGIDERVLDARLTNNSVAELSKVPAEGSNLAIYYWHYLGGLLRGDLGNSISLGRPVRALLAERLGVSLRSLAAGLAMAWVLAFSVALLLEIHRRALWDRALSLAAGVLLCIPAALLALGCLQLGGSPALALAAILFPRFFKYVHSLARNAASAPHVFAAYAFGERGVRIAGLHVVAPALPELLALAGVSVSLAVGATIPVEALCDSPGVGQLVWQAALARDLPVIVNVTLLVTAVTAAANLAADVGRTLREVGS
ncbi:MAG: hypothetical protein C5B51_23480 [Terriglobia bacterium]|nr:MAG: hypothetical protein C5B51_23480 [Terriglobia bacterium]